MYKRKPKNLLLPNRKSWQQHKELVGSAVLRELLDNLKAELYQQEQQHLYRWQDHPYNRGYQAGQLNLLKKWIVDIESLEALVINEKAKRDTENIFVKIKERLINDTP